MTETTTPLQLTTVEPTKLQPTTPAQPNAPTAPDSPHVTETPSPDHLLTLTDLTRQFVRRGTPFDGRMGYAQYGPVELDEHVEHIWMEKLLDETGGRG